MKAPAFWWTTSPGFAARALAPAGMIYSAITAARMARPGAEAGAPVFCVGNLVAGGAGKTPAAITLTRLLQAEGRSPAILSRGYGRTVRGGSSEVLRVDPDRHCATESGDEPLLLARIAPTFVSANRVSAAAAALASGADCLILDDGLQNPALRKDWTLVVADGASGIGNGLCIPAGPLRAPVARQWPNVSLLAVIGDGAAGRRLVALAAAKGVPATCARLVPDAATIARWRGRRLFAFAGIGRPQKFFATLAAAGLDVVGTRTFPDHHVFAPSDIDRLRDAAAEANATLVTTVKDQVRLPPTLASEALPVELVFDDVDRVLAAIRLRL